MLDFILAAGVVTLPVKHRCHEGVEVHINNTDAIATILPRVHMVKIHEHMAHSEAIGMMCPNALVAFSGAYQCEQAQCGFLSGAKHTG